MRVLLLGSGGREHALAWKLAQSPLLTALTVAPGNAGMAEQWPCRDIDASSPTQVVALARELKADLVVVGPEAPLVAGVADALAAAGIAVFGPGQAAAHIEGSKAFAKEVMAAAQIPTARAEVFDDVEKAAARAQAWGPVVVKADGLAAGKGVVVADSGDEAAAAVRALGQLPAGQRLVLEERLQGPELSVMALCDGERYALLPPSQDHKRLGDGDVGPNTGGMGAYAPARLLSAEQLQELGERVIAPTLRELARRKSPFRGALYAGLMLTPDGPKVLEFNCRLGDPETQVLMMQVSDDILPLMHACALGQLRVKRIATHDGISVGVVVAAHGYPGSVRVGDPIEGLGSQLPGQIFHAGTKRVDGRVVSAGGRVLTVCARGDTVHKAREQAYRLVETIRLPGAQYRRDIAAHAAF